MRFYIEEAKSTFLRALTSRTAVVAEKKRNRQIDVDSGLTADGFKPESSYDKFRISTFIIDSISSALRQSAYDLLNKGQIPLLYPAR